LLNHNKPTEKTATRRRGILQAAAVGRATERKRRRAVRMGSSISCRDRPRRTFFRAVQ